LNHLACYKPARACAFRPGAHKPLAHVITSTETKRLVPRSRDAEPDNVRLRDGPVGAFARARVVRAQRRTARVFDASGGRHIPQGLS